MAAPVCVNPSSLQVDVAFKGATDVRDQIYLFIPPAFDRNPSNVENSRFDLKSLLGFQSSQFFLSPLPIRYHSQWVINFPID